MKKSENTSSMEFIQKQSQLHNEKRQLQESNIKNREILEDGKKALARLKLDVAFNPSQTQAMQAKQDAVSQLQTQTQAQQERIEEITEQVEYIERELLPQAIAKEMQEAVSTAKAKLYDEVEAYKKRKGDAFPLLLKIHYAGIKLEQAIENAEAFKIMDRPQRVQNFGKLSIEIDGRRYHIYEAINLLYSKLGEPIDDYHFLVSTADEICEGEYVAECLERRTAPAKSKGRIIFQRLSQLDAVSSMAQAVAKRDRRQYDTANDRYELEIGIYVSLPDGTEYVHKEGGAGLRKEEIEPEIERIKNKYREKYQIFEETIEEQK